MCSFGTVYGVEKHWNMWPRVQGSCKKLLNLKGCDRYLLCTDYVLDKLLCMIHKCLNQKMQLQSPTMTSFILSVDFYPLFLPKWENILISIKLYKNANKGQNYFKWSWHLSKNEHTQIKGLLLNMRLKKHGSSDTRHDFILFIHFQGFWDEGTFIPSVCLRTDCLDVNTAEQETQPLLHLSSQCRYNTGALHLGWHW